MPPAKNAPVDSESTATHPSLALPVLKERLARRRRPHVLDFGATVADNVELFLGFAGRLTVADLYQVARQAGGWQQLLRSTGREVAGMPIVPLRQGDPGADAVLLWDLVNYLDEEQLRQLYSRLRPWLRPGTYLHFQVVYVDEMPVRPRAYRMVDWTTLAYEPDRGRPRPSPRFKEPQLLGCFEGGAVENTFLLRHGVQEYLLSFA